MRGAAVPLATTLFMLAAGLAGCFGTEERTEWAYDVTQLDALAGQGRTGAGVTIAVLDTGVDVTHPSLRHLRNGDAGDGELVAFRDFLGGGRRVQDAHDPDGHGTHVVGIMAARPADLGDRLLSGGVRLEGASPGARYVVARVCSGDECDGRAIIDAIRWATQRGADVMSLSLGGTPNVPGLLGDALRDDLRDAVDDAIARGVVVVAAAGNDPDAGDVAAPGTFRDVIAVAAVDADLEVASFSQPGDGQANDCRRMLLEIVGRCHPHQKPEIAAPGVEILSTWKDDTYATASGTSQATPFVTSAVALVLQGRPDITDRDGVVALKTALVDAARDLPGQETPHDDQLGYGLLQAQGAMQRYR